MDKRVLIPLTISMGLALVWMTVSEKSRPAPQAAAAATEPATVNPAALPVAGAAPVAAEAALLPGAPPPLESPFTQRGLYRAIFSSRGAAPTSWRLLDEHYKVDHPKESNKTAEPIDLVQTRAPNLPFAITFSPGGGGKRPIGLSPDATFRAETVEDGTLVYVWEGPEARVEKRYVAQPGSYVVDLTVRIVNKGEAALPHYLQMQLHGWQDPAAKPGGMFSRHTAQSSGQCDLGGKLKSEGLEALLKEGVDQLGQVRWVGIGQPYFMIAAALKESSEPRRCNLFAAPDGSLSAILTAEGRTVPAHGTLDYHFVLFAGPKILSQLDAVKVDGVDAGFASSMDYGWKEILARPMLAVLKAIHLVVPNWGLCIIVFTILLKVVTWYPTQSSMKSMKAMAQLKPEMDKLRERFGDDKEKMNLATMELYKRHGVNPIGGCLPMLIQLPIYFAFYTMLGSAVELYREPFFGWIRDLTAPDPYFILPVVMGLLMFLQQKTQPTPPDPQQKMMAYMMPVMITVFSLFVGVGLTIYMLTNTVLTFLQQRWMNRHPGKPARA